MKSFKFGDLVKLNKAHVVENKVFTVVSSDESIVVIGQYVTGGLITEKVEVLTLKNEECELIVPAKEVTKVGG